MVNEGKGIFLLVRRTNGDPLVIPEEYSVEGYIELASEKEANAVVRQMNRMLGHDVPAHIDDDEYDDAWQDALDVDEEFYELKKLERFDPHAWLTEQAKERNKRTS